MKLLRTLTVLALAAQVVGLTIGGKQMHVERDSDGLQDIVRLSMSRSSSQDSSFLLRFHISVLFTDLLNR